MVIAALVSFAILLVAWIAAPSGATPREASIPAMEAEVVAEAA